MDKKKMPLAPIITIGLGVIMLVATIICVALDVWKLNVVDIIASLVLIAYGIIAWVTNLKKSGWGLGALLFAVVAINGVTEAEGSEDFLTAAVCTVLAVVFAVLLVRSNVKKGNANNQ